MRYVEKVLQPDEVVKFHGKVSWAVYLRYLFIYSIISMIIIAGNGPNSIAPTLVILSSIFLIPWAKRYATEIAVTNRRIIFKTGLISYRTIEMNMDKIEGVNVEQSLVGRLLNYGTVVVRGIGAGREPLKCIDDPFELRNHVTAR
jgi:uncharacterized membrane protein YdbT with pleckstrin-like domain